MIRKTSILLILILVIALGTPNTVLAAAPETPEQKQVREAGLSVKWIDAGNGYTSIILYERQPDYDTFFIGAGREDQSMKFGLANEKGEIITPLQYDSIAAFPNEYAVSSDGDKLFLASTVKIDYEAESTKDMIVSDKTLLIDGTGKVVLDLSKYDFAIPYKGEMLAISRGLKSGVIDWEGNELLPLDYDSINFLKNGLISATNYPTGTAGQKFGLFDSSGNAVTEMMPGYISEGESADDPLRVEKDGKVGYIDKTGKEITDFCYDADSSIFWEGAAAVSAAGKWGLVDRSGKEIVALSYDRVFNFSEGLALVEKNGKYGQINMDGDVIIPIEFDYLEGFVNGAANAAAPQSGYSQSIIIDKKGNTVAGPKEFYFYRYNSIYQGQNRPAADIMLSVPRAYHALFDEDGNRLTRFSYGSFDYQKDGLIIVNDADSVVRKLGIVNRYGAEIVPPIFNSLTFIDSNTCAVIVGDNENVRSGILTLPSDAQTKKPQATDMPISVYLNGLDLLFDTEPTIINNRTMVPMRKIFEVLGADVTWDGKAGKVTAVRDGVTVELIIGEDTAVINGKTAALDVPATIQNDRALVPLRFVAEALDCEVDWSGADRRVIINLSFL